MITWPKTCQKGVFLRKYMFGVWPGGMRVALGIRPALEAELCEATLIKGRLKPYKPYKGLRTASRIPPGRVKPWSSHPLDKPPFCFILPLFCCILPNLTPYTASECRFGGLFAA